MTNLNNAMFLSLLSLLFFGLLSACDSENLPSATDESLLGGTQQAGSDSTTDMISHEEGGEMTAGAMVEPWVQIGTGFRRYESLEAGQVVPIIAGIQGGFHVWGAFIGEGFNDLDVRVIYSMELNGEVLARADYTEFELPKNSEREFEYAGVAVIYNDNDDVERTSDQEFVLKLRVETQDGLSLEDQIRLRPHCCE